MLAACVTLKAQGWRRTRTLTLSNHFAVSRADVWKSRTRDFAMKKAIEKDIYSWFVWNERQQDGSFPS